MELLVNDEPCAIRTGPGGTLRDLARCVCPAGGPDRRLIVSVMCDGQVIPPDQLEATLDRPAEQFNQVAFQTQRMDALVAQTLTEAIALFRAADQRRQEVADLLAEGQQQAALEQLGQVMADWRQVQDSVALVIEALGTPVDAPIGGGASIQAALAGITAQLRELKAALMSGDFVLVGDILRFELEGPFADWLATLENLSASISP